MAYTQFKDFTLLENNFGVLTRMLPLFESIRTVEPTVYLTEAVKVNLKMSIRTEKSKSEMLVAPVLLELRRRNEDRITFFSGENLNADAALGLNGECDFVITKDENSVLINAPIIQIVEAKRQDFELGTAQCSAQMIGARIFNEKHGNNITKIYGCVTTGTEWLFLKLDNNLITIDNKKYYLQNLPELLGVFQMIIDEYKDILD